MRLPHALLATLLLVASTPLAAQREKEPRRPKLSAADTNDPRAYYDFALDLLTKDPEKAADALYWSVRLEPTWADAYYARRIALLLADGRRLERYWSGDRRTIQSDDIRRIDSLFYHALTINPFVSQTLDRKLFEAVADNWAEQYTRGSSVSPSEVRFYIDRQMLSAPAATKAWLAYGEGRFDDALMYYAKAIKDDKRNGPLHSERARVFYQMNQPDSSLAELNAAIEDLRKRDKKELIFVYQSKALTEQSIGIVQSRLGHTDAAKEAFGRALQEDLAFYPAHLQLAYMALEAKDTTGALSEMDLAVQLRDDDAAAQYLYGFTLGATGKYADAETHLRKAVKIDPVYAAPYFALGFALEKSGRNADASVAYYEFLDRAARRDPRRGEAQARIAAIASSVKPLEEQR